MIRRWMAGCALATAGLTGCVGDDFRLKPLNATRNQPVDVPKNLPAASLEAASRVDALGGQILAANPSLGIRPVFRAIGVPEVVLFHKGDQELFISDGMVQKCRTEGELAAALCSELGKMASESRAVGRGVALADPPLAPNVGGDVVGGGGGPDMTREAERALWERKNPRSNGRALPAARDPGELSRECLNNAGYTPDELLRVAPLLRQAEANPSIEKLLSGRR
jgi:hypothetical protein